MSVPRSLSHSQSSLFVPRTLSLSFNFSARRCIHTDHLFDIAMHFKTIVATILFPVLVSQATPIAKRDGKRVFINSKVSLLTKLCRFCHN